MEQQESYTTIALDRPSPGAFPALGIEIQEEYANLVISFGPGTFLVQAVTADQMNDICRQWLSRHAQAQRDQH